MLIKSNMYGHIFSLIGTEHKFTLHVVQIKKKNFDDSYHVTCAVVFTARLEISEAGQTRISYCSEVRCQLCRFGKEVLYMFVKSLQFFYNYCSLNLAL